MHIFLRFQTTRWVPKVAIETKRSFQEITILWTLWS